MSNEQWIVEGFSFHNKLEYEKAAKEQESIAYIKANSDFSNAKSALKIYMNLVEKDLFSTVVGYAFMENLRRHVVSQKIVPENMIPAVPVAKQSSFKGKEGEVTDKSMKELKEKYEKVSYKRSISMYLNVFLIMIVAAMFAITYYSPKNNEDAAREKIQNEYSSWKQQLEEKEQELEEREADLK
ncbi:MAG: hypothetical protein Q4F05_18540 [bacterium]|nr:hypothetical protein [bacterium]